MHTNKLEVLRWKESDVPQEHVLRSRMLADGLSPYAWSNAPGDRYTVHTHAYEKVLYCIKGSICFVLPDRPDGIEYLDLKPGDCMILPANIRHSALVGPDGTTCLEAPRYK